MGYLVAYRFTGADPKRLDELMPAVCRAIESTGNDCYCTYFDEELFQQKKFSVKDIFDHAFKKADELKGLFVIVDGDEKSEGMLIEVGYSMAKGYKVIVAKKEGVKTHLDKLANKSIDYKDIEDLVAKIKEIA